MKDVFIYLNKTLFILIRLFFIYMFCKLLSGSKNKLRKVYYQQIRLTKFILCLMNFKYALLYF